MKFLNIIFLFTFILSFGGCQRNHPITPSSFQSRYLIFGHFYGECFGESCVEIFKIEDGKIYEDTLDNYPSWQNLPNTLAFVQLPDEKYDGVKDLFNKVPAGLYDEENQVIGQPDAGDWGGFYVETKIDGQRRSWLIDKKQTNIPPYLHGFTAAIEEAINKLDSD